MTLKFNRVLEAVEAQVHA